MTLHTREESRLCAAQVCRTGKPAAGLTADRPHELHRPQLQIIDRPCLDLSEQIVLSEFRDHTSNFDSCAEPNTMSRKASLHVWNCRNHKSERECVSRN